MPGYFWGMDDRGIVYCSQMLLYTIGFFLSRVLSIAARTEALGGSFKMESAPGQGASVLFTFRLGGHHHKIPR
jgi:hypothetical protein